MKPIIIRKQAGRIAMILFTVAGLLNASMGSVRGEILDGVTFADAPGSLYAPVREVASALGWAIQWDGTSETLSVNNRAVNNAASVKRLVDGTALLSVDALRHLGASVSWDAESQTAIARSGEHSATIARREKRVEIDRSQQRLRAWQGKLLVLDSPVSTGRSGHRTPKGNFTAGPYKARMHYSSLYNNAPMPYSVQVNGNIFIHGYSSVPNYPASHGCIRVPLSGGNPARWLYEWIDRGTPVAVTGDWTG